MATVISGDFEWDDAKAASNRNKHRVRLISARVATSHERRLYEEDA